MRRDRRYWTGTLDSNEPERMEASGSHGGRQSSYIHMGIEDASDEDSQLFGRGMEDVADSDDQQYQIRYDEHELTDYQPADTSGEQENDDTNDDLVVDEDPSGMDPQHNKASESAPDPAVTAPSPVPIRDRLLVMQATPQSWAKFCRMLHRPNLEAGPKARNQSLLPYVESLTDDDLLFPQDLPLGHCSVLCTATQRGSDIFVTPQLRESGSTQSAPRTTLLEGIPRKVLVSHIIAANEAHSAPTPPA
ncbi:hypothetical protein N7470_009836 [Penicillium chermesinum]|nr:hypothetical protein N7470_009836 [Penicillium chermesinum]